MHYDIEYVSSSPYERCVSGIHETTIKNLLSSFGERLIEAFSKSTISDCLVKYLKSEALDEAKKIGDALTQDGDDYNFKVIIPNRTIFQILVSLEINGLIYNEINDMYWLTDKGKKMVYEALAFKKSPEISF